jgi:hypothetical protein
MFAIFLAASEIETVAFYLEIFYRHFVMVATRHHYPKSSNNIFSQPVVLSLFFIEKFINLFLF